MYLYFPFPDNVMLEARSTFMSFPIRNQDGFFPLGIIGSILFIIALILLFIGIKAISYDGNGNCNFEYVGEDLLNGECNFEL